MISKPFESGASTSIKRRETEIERNASTILMGKVRSRSDPQRAWCAGDRDLNTRMLRMHNCVTSLDA